MVSVDVKRHVYLPSSADSVDVKRHVYLPSSADSVDVKRHVYLPSSADSVDVKHHVYLPSSADSVDVKHHVYLPSSADAIYAVALQLLVRHVPIGDGRPQPHQPARPAAVRSAEPGLHKQQGHNRQRSQDLLRQRLVGSLRCQRSGSRLRVGVGVSEIKGGNKLLLLLLIAFI